jgi:hypothetical protein
MKTSRNAACPCGSGRKHKNCCQPKESQAAPAGLKSNSTAWILGFLGILALLTAALAFGPFSQQKVPDRTGVTSSPLPLGQQGAVGAAQPPGPAPAGKVWSAEHGHWHDAPGAQALPPAASQTITPQPTTPATYTPQPPGPAPEGKVWSTDHGHWHDINQQ